MLILRETREGPKSEEGGSVEVEQILKCYSFTQSEGPRETQVVHRNWKWRGNCFLLLENPEETSPSDRLASSPMKLILDFEPPQSCKRINLCCFKSIILCGQRIKGKLKHMERIKERRYTTLRKTHL